MAVPATGTAHRERHAGPGFSLEADVVLLAQVTPALGPGPDYEPGLTSSAGQFPLMAMGPAARPWGTGLPDPPNWEQANPSLPQDPATCPLGRLEDHSLLNGPLGQISDAGNRLIRGGAAEGRQPLGQHDSEPPILFNAQPARWPDPGPGPRQPPLGVSMHRLGLAALLQTGGKLSQNDPNMDSQKHAGAKAGQMLTSNMANSSRQLLRQQLASLGGEVKQEGLGGSGQRGGAVNFNLFQAWQEGPGGLVPPSLHYGAPIAEGTSSSGAPGKGRTTGIML